MLKKTLIASALLAAVSASAAENTYYARVDGAYNFGTKLNGVKALASAFRYGKTKYEKNVSGQVGFGVYLPSNFRSDLTVGFGNYKNKMTQHVVAATANSSLSVESVSVLLNGYYDITNISGFVPYVGVGVGAASNKGKFNLASVYKETAKRTTTFAWQAGAGVAYNINENVAVDLAYRYADLGKVAKTASIPAINYTGKTIKLTTSQVSLGLRFSF